MNQEEISGLKRRVPINVWRALSKFIDVSNPYIVGDTEPGSNLLRYIERIPTSDFHFTCISHDAQRGFLLEWKPKNSSDNSSFKCNIKTSELEKYFSSWVSLIQEYNTIKTSYDVHYKDKIEEEYSKEFEEVFDTKMFDDYAVFKPSERFIIEDYLDKVQSKIEAYAPDRPDLVAEVKSHAENVRQNLEMPKKWVIKNITVLWAKLARLGKHVFSDLTKEFFQKIASKSVNWVVKNHQLIGEYLQDQLK